LTLVERAAPVFAMDSGTDRGLVLVELGASSETEGSGPISPVGPAVQIEVEPIDNWLEIEFGAATDRSQTETDWALDLAFKKPFQVSSAVEIEPGLGPSWTHATQSGVRSGTWGVEASVDFVFWRTQRMGLFLEPSYGFSFGNGNRTSFGLSVGIIVGIL